MGLDIESARFLLQSRQSGVSFARCLTLGRQHYFLGRRETNRLFVEFDVPIESARKVCDHIGRSPYSEPFWEAIGVEDLQTMDASDFECATVIHDLNLPVPERLKERFDTVCDFGTIEHVFNFPLALANCMSMVRVGGRLILHTTANNYCGHGFYQFSPELFYRALAPANGYQVERMVAVEYGPRRRWFDVADPERVRSRVSLINAFPVLLFVQAVRVAQVPLFKHWPQQSDYVTMWEAHQKRQSSSPSGESTGQRLFERVKYILIETCPNLARALQAVTTSSLNHEYAWRNRRSYRPASKRSKAT